jgi:acyl-CoA thioesterase FadM
MRYEIRRKATDELLVEGHTRHGITDHDLKPFPLKRKRPEFYQDVADTL